MQDTIINTVKTIRAIEIVPYYYSTFKNNRTLLEHVKNYVRYANDNGSKDKGLITKINSEV